MNKRRFVFLSPHLDDGVLSCGGLIASLRGKAQVEVWTVFSRSAWRGPYSPAALWLQGSSGGRTAKKLFMTRRAEDREACRMLGANWKHLPWADGAYRKDRLGRFIYPADLDGQVSPADGPTITHVAAYLRKRLKPDDIVFAPLAMAPHVDHHIVRRAADIATSNTAFYYPELPYFGHRGGDPGAPIPNLTHVGYSLSESEIREWVDAVGCFASQLYLLQDAVGSVQDLILNHASSDISFYVPDIAFPLLQAKLGLLGRANPRIMLPGAVVRATPPGSTSGGLRQRSETLNVKPGRAPIAVFAFRRLDTLKKTLRSLEKCNGFAGEEVIVYADAPRPGSPVESLEVGSVRACLRNWCAANGASLREAGRNMGLHKSITSGVSELLETHERIIVLEDDLIVSPSFLKFMNGALNAYAEREDIVQVSGYMLPHNNRLPALGLLRAPGSWGWGTWRRAWKHYNDDAVFLADEVRKHDTQVFDFDGTYDNLDALDRNASGELNTWAVRWYASVFLRGGLTVYPEKSLVRNIGFGDDGTNCKPGPMAKVFARQSIRWAYVKLDWKSVGDRETDGYAEATKTFYRWQQNQWAKPSFRERALGSLQRLKLIPG